MKSSNLDIGNVARQRIEWLVLGWSSFGLILFIATKDLWLGRTAFPQVPLIGLGHYLPTWVDTFCFIIVMTTLVWTIATSPILPIGGKAKARMSSLPTRWADIRWPLALFTDALVALVICNQHRLQPWAYLAWLTAILVFFCRPRRAVVLLRILVIGIYLHSAFMKFDYAFITTLGLSFLQPIKELFGFQMTWDMTDHILAAIFPVAEVLIGIGLIFRKSRRWAVLLAIGMHAALVYLLWRELNHELPVLVWNLYFIWQVVVLFGHDVTDKTHLAEPASAASVTTPDTPSFAAQLHTYGHPIAATVIAAAIFLPFLEPFGLFDLWPAWGLYAPRSSKCELYVDEASIDRLPERWRVGAEQYVDAEHGWSPGMEIGLPRKSLDQLSVPIYPQGRFQLGVALALVRNYELGNAATVVCEGTSHRMTGNRRRETFRGLSEIESAANRYWLNVEPRITSRDD